MRDAEARPVPDAWVVMVGGPGWVAADEEGRFVFGPVRAGTHRLRARAPDGREGEVEVRVPGPADVIVGGAAHRKPSRKRCEHQRAPNAARKAARAPRAAPGPAGGGSAVCARRPADLVCSWGTSRR